MSVVIKTNAMKYKDAEGNYQAFNAVAQETTAEQIEDIESAGQAQISAVQQKGTETVASIPDDYTELSGDVDDLKSALNNDIGVTPGEYLDALNDDILKCCVSKNLLDSSGSYTDGRLMSDYTVKAEGYVGIATTDYIPVETPNYVSFTRATSVSARGFEVISALAAYDAEKTPIDYILNSIIKDDYLEIPEGAVFIRVSINKAYAYTSPASYKPMLSYDTTVAAYEEYHEPYYEIIKNYPHCTEEISCWGDSLTYGSGSTSGHSYPDVLASLTGKTVHKCGFPGDTSAEICGYQGAMPLVVAPVTIPASGSVNVDIYTYDKSDTDTPFRYPSIDASNINPVVIGGIAGELDLSEFGNPSSRTFAFTRTNSGNTTQLLDYTNIITSGSINRRKDIAIIWIGANGGWGSTNSTLISQIQNMVNYQDAAVRKYIIVGIAVGLSTAYAIPLESEMQLAFGNHYINMRDYLVRCGLAENGITPTSDDEQDISDGKVPRSLKAQDGVHLNDAGYNSVAQSVFRRGKELGYW